MKKILVVLSLISFVAVNAVSAQTPVATAKADQKEVTAAPASQVSSVATESPAAVGKAGHPSCCQKGATAKSCCKSGGDSKACTKAEKAKCAEKMKAEAAAPAIETATPGTEATPQTN